MNNNPYEAIGRIVAVVAVILVALTIGLAVRIFNE